MNRQTLADILGIINFTNLLGKNCHNLALQWQNYQCSQLLLALDLISVLLPSAIKALETSRGAGGCNGFG